MTLTNFINKDKNAKNQSINKLNLADVIQNQLKRYLQSHPSSAIAFDQILRISLHVTLDNCKEELLMIKYLINEIGQDSDHNLFYYRSNLERYKSFSKLKQKLQEQKCEKIPYTNLQKMHKDVCLFLNVFRDTCFELEDSGTYTCLMEVILGHAQEEYDDKTLETAYSVNKNKIQFLEQQLYKEKVIFLKQLEELSSQITKLEIKTENMFFYDTIKMEYLNNWEETRQHQLTYKFLRNQKTIAEHINEINLKLEIEERAHYELVCYINENMADLKEQLGYWTEIYDGTIENKEREVLKIKHTAEAHYVTHTNLVLLYEKYKQEIEEWHLFKEQKRLELLKKRIQAAIKIQTWWRGVMVRRYLGRYRVLRKLKLKKRTKGKKSRK